MVSSQKARRQRPNRSSSSITRRLTASVPPQGTSYQYICTMAAAFQRYRTSAPQEPPAGMYQRLPVAAPTDSSASGAVRSRSHDWMGHRVGVNQGRHLERLVEPLDRLRHRTAFQAARVAPIVERLDAHPLRAVSLGQRLGDLPGRVLPIIDHDVQLIVGIILCEQQLQAFFQERVAAAETQDDRRLGANALAGASPGENRAASAERRPSAALGRRPAQRESEKWKRRIRPRADRSPESIAHWQPP